MEAVCSLNRNLFVTLTSSSRPQDLGLESRLRTLARNNKIQKTQELSSSTKKKERKLTNTANRRLQCKGANGLYRRSRLYGFVFATKWHLAIVSLKDDIFLGGVGTDCAGMMEEDIHGT